MTHRILLASSDSQQTDIVRRGLEGSGVTLAIATSAGEVPRLIDRDRVAALLIDLSLGAGEGSELLKRVAGERPWLPVVVLADADQAACALKQGAVDFVDPAAPELRLRTALRNALMQGRLRAELREAARAQRSVRGLETLVGRSPAFLRSKELLERAAQKDIAVLLIGETGAGKESAARALHAESDRATSPFIAVRCASLSADRLGVELFGERDGRVGAFEEARGGTVYLDQVEHLGADHQERLLEVLQESYVRRLGDPRSIPVNVRVVAATCHDQSQWAAHGVREDLLHRIGVFPIEVPPLRDRVEDIELLALGCMKRFAERHDKLIRGIEPAALEALSAHDWPGNLPEFETAIERAVLVADRERLTLQTLPAGVVSALPSGQDAALRLMDPASVDPLASLLSSEDVRPFEELERQILVHALKCTHWNVLETARRLRIGRATVYRKIERFGLTRSGDRSVV